MPNLLSPAATDLPAKIDSLPELMSVALQLGATDVKDWSAEEEEIARGLNRVSPALVELFRCAIDAGHDPLGEAFCRILSADLRRPLGAIYTPDVIVDWMVSRAEKELHPERVVDPGAGSGRFIVKAGRRFPNALLVGVEINPVAAILARGHIAAAGLSPRATVILGDFRDRSLPHIDGRTLYIGNPPYVRHHQIEAEWKSWLAETAGRLGLSASRLSGLHVHFYLAIAERANKGDVGALITAAEWLDVNYGKLVRGLLLGPLGGKAVHIVEPTAAAFPGTATTAAITDFEIGSSQPVIGLRRVQLLEGLDDLSSTIQVPRARLTAEARWSILSRTPVEKRNGFIELGEICRVHRGQVTGKNRVWIEGPHSGLLPDAVLFRSITKARELFAADGNLADASILRRVIDLPTDLDEFNAKDKKNIERFLKEAKSLGADLGFVARHRKAWWSVGLRVPAPILATYMARRPPAFVRNAAGARHINVAHGLYPREPMSDISLKCLADYLSTYTSTNDGRTYAGGLTKFEPREMERLIVPAPEFLATGVILPVQ